MQLFYRIAHFAGGLALLALAVAFVVFAVANRQTVALDLWPFARAVETPTYLISVGALLAGLFLGGLLGWAISGPSRAKAAAETRRLAAVEAELEDMRAQQQSAPDRGAGMTAGATLLAAPPPAAPIPAPFIDPGAEPRRAAR